MRAPQGEKPSIMVQERVGIAVFLGDRNSIMVLGEALVPICLGTLVPIGLSLRLGSGTPLERLPVADILFVRLIFGPRGAAHSKLLPVIDQRRSLDERHKSC